MKIARSKNFSIEEDKYIIDNYRDMFDDEIAEQLNRPVGSITRRRQRLGCWYVQQEVTSSLPNEVWKVIPIDGERYKVSNMGRIKSGKKLVSLFINSNGYVQWRIVNPSKNIAVNYRVHRLVAEHFCPRPESWDESYHVHHIDHNPQNNRFDNLEWLSPSEHRAKHS